MYNNVFLLMTDPKQKLLKRNKKKVILTAKVCSKSGCLRELDGWLPNRGVKYIRTNLCQRLYLFGWLLNRGDHRLHCTCKSYKYFMQSL